MKKITNKAIENICESEWSNQYANNWGDVAYEVWLSYNRKDLKQGDQIKIEKQKGVYSYGEVCEIITDSVLVVYEY
jgi:hypothetical protein